MVKKYNLPSLFFVKNMLEKKLNFFFKHKFKGCSQMLEGK